jgi:hypothetical protein
VAPENGSCARVRPVPHFALTSGLQSSADRRRRDAGTRRRLLIPLRACSLPVLPLCTPGA